MFALRDFGRSAGLTKGQEQPLRKQIKSGRPRLPAAERRQEMLREAAEHFAVHGFESPTRQIADALGVTQALIYKHFASKDDLIEQTLASLFTGSDDKESWLDTSEELEAALTQFYQSFVSHSTDIKMRLFIRAGLDGRSWPTRCGDALTRRLFLPTIGMLRLQTGLPEIASVPAMRGERELVMLLHASMVFLGIRRHIYQMQMPKNLDDVVSLYVSTFLDGAAPAIRKLHESGEESLKIPLAINRL